MKRVTVLGAGLVGKAIAADLCGDYEVTAVDLKPAALDSLRARAPVKMLAADLRDAAAVHGAVQHADLVIGAVPGFMGFKTLEAVIEAGRNIVDISFFPEDAFLLDGRAKQRGVTAVVDCGVAPGMSNLLLSYWAEQMRVNRFECLVGGLPVVRRKPFEYRAAFSPIDVLEEYTRPARYVENGQAVVRPALSDAELVEFERVGTLEAFNTDGLRSLLKTMDVPNMKEKTLRYPGHCALIQTLRDAGFFAKEPLEVSGQRIAPFDVTARVLFDNWKWQEGEEDFTVMRVTIAGERDDRPKTITYNLFDVYDRETRTSSMARTTGYTAAAVARLVLENRFARKGISPPEYVGREEGCLQAVMEYLRARNVDYGQSEE
ncbi:MAG: saccharopine dehydrogenase NADP-binding domain-containing protein [Acidobacteriia bacterium]|nr:saccharopine dehydrogenase NADP-binding domain-containing protein [Terriglobia bacterium]